MWLNQGRFMGNGGCGYVLKPDYIRGTAVGTAAAPLEPKILTVKVVKSSGWTGGWGLEKEPDLYASLAIAGEQRGIAIVLTRRGAAVGDRDFFYRI